MNKRVTLHTYTTYTRIRLSRTRIIPEVVVVVEIPSRSMAYDGATVFWTNQHRLFPEVVVHRFQTQRDEELLGFFHDLDRCVILNNGVVVNLYA